MDQIGNECFKDLSPLDLRAIHDLVELLNVEFLNINPESDYKDEDVNFMNYFQDVDFSRMSEPLTMLEAFPAIENLGPEIKRLIFVKVLNASQKILFWKTEKEIITYFQSLKFIGAKEMMMLNCSYILRNLLPYNGCNCELASRGNSYDYEMWITNEEDFHCNIYINTGCGNRGDFVNIFIDYHTILRAIHIRGQLPSFLNAINAINDKLYLISKTINENNCFQSYKKHFFSYEEDLPSVDDMNHGVWFKFYNIQFQ